MSRTRKEGVLSRWSRLKRDSVRADSETEASPIQPTVEEQEASANPAEVNQSTLKDEPLTELPSLDELGPESDFQGFMKPDVDDGLRRAALKKLFSDPRFNVADGLDVYAEDYTKLESMTPAMVAGLKHAQRLLFGTGEDDKAAAATTAATPGKRPENDDQAVTLQEEDQTAQTQYRQEKEEEAVIDGQDGAPDDGTAVTSYASAANPKG